MKAKTNNTASLNCRELRIGNYVLSPIAGEAQINSKGIQRIEEGTHRYEPIPLTEEWLVKFGFDNEKIPNSPRYFWKLGYFTYNESHKAWWYDSKRLNHQPEHVHSLQNLYFALTGTELTIKETV